MKYYELVTKVYLKKDIDFKHIHEFIGNLINYSMIKDEYLTKIHKTYKIKNYSFCPLYPISIDKIYKKNNIYQFMIRTLDKKMITNLQKQIDQQKNSYLVVVDTKIRTWKQRIINELQTMTTTILTLKDNEIPENLTNIKNRNKYWIEGCSKRILIDRIENNLIKKYNLLYPNEQIKNVSLIRSIKIRNPIPIVINYKNSTLVGNKFNIKVNLDSNSQKLANIAMVSGVLEKNSSVGCGFCKGVYLD